ncbi:membrane protein [[Actinobacillus] muris]|uniref:UPF0283 membrane protein RO21_06545 n=1 Tax=Muribacter muris TaxID=67855 RepID=A0A0J5P4K9_9PAST|nr:TIGR01620 family protein [Muribacter muris]KMK51363.1 membrane protein [[Actinobacillus] muris] [Muribacter muris]
MDKRIFEEQAAAQAFDFQPKREFSEADISPDIELSADDTAAFQEENIKPTRFWIRLLLGMLVLLGVALIAQSVQWLLETWQQRQWIAFLFACVFCVVSLAGIGAIVNEWRKLVRLRKHYYDQQASRQFLVDKPTASGETAAQFCNQIATKLTHNPTIQHSISRWQTELDEAYNAQEVLFLFNQNVLNPIDEQVKKWISKNAAENALLVAVSPLAVVDVLMVAWRNIALINRISRAYGMELGYLSRLKLFKMVLKNMVFAGVSEMATDLGMTFFSQNLTAQISMRAAQGVAVGLLTARLGIKAMAFCRPISFRDNEQPSLSAVRKELLGVVKTTLFSKTAENVQYEQR